MFSPGMRIHRVRVDVEHDIVHNGKPHFTAKGDIEIGGPDCTASASDENAYQSVSLLIDKLDGLLRKRSSEHKAKIHHPHPVELDTTLPKTTP